MSSDSYYIKFKPDEIKHAARALEQFHGYHIGKRSSNANDDELRLLHDIEYVHQCIRESIKTIEGICEDKKAGQKIRDEFTEKLLKILQNNSDPMDLPGALGKLLEDYEIIGNPEQSLPF